MTETVVKEITCPKCERVWPTIAEQGIVTELIDRCYACFSAEVVQARDDRVANADYSVQNCGHCGGLPPKVLKCVACGGKGWETVDKGKEDLPPKIAYPH